MAEIKLQLAEGRNVPLEDGRPWPTEGATVTVTHYIRRRLADGDLVQISEPETVSEEPDSQDNSNDDTARKPVKTGGNKHV